MTLSALKLRNYAPPAPDIAEDWYCNPIQEIAVEVLGGYSPSADGACRVKYSDNLIAYVKPRPDSQNQDVVANEKIAADLGHILELPVVPIVVRQPMEGWPIYTAMSFACLPQGRHWEQGPVNRSEELDRQLEILRVFWTLIGDIDHGGHPQNLLYEFDGSDFRLLAIDHSYAFGHGQSDPLTLAPSLGYGTAEMQHVVSVRSKTIDTIQSLDWSKVEHIFMRLTDGLLTESIANEKLNWVAKRRDNLPNLLL